MTLDVHVNLMRGKYELLKFIIMAMTRDYQLTDHVTPFF